MKTKKEKKMAAAMAAVAAYMQQEQEAVYEAVASAPVAAFRMELNAWGQSGRQGMMQMRNLMQMRAFDRFR